MSLQIPDLLSPCVLGTSGPGGVWGKINREECIQNILMALENGRWECHDILNKQVYKQTTYEVLNPGARVIPSEAILTDGTGAKFTAVYKANFDDDPSLNLIFICKWQNLKM